MTFNRHINHKIKKKNIEKREITQTVSNTQKTRERQGKIINQKVNIKAKQLQT